MSKKVNNQKITQNITPNIEFRGRLSYSKNTTLKTFTLWATVANLKVSRLYVRLKPV